MKPKLNKFSLGDTVMLFSKNRKYFIAELVWHGSNSNSFGYVVDIKSNISYEENRFALTRMVLIEKTKKWCWNTHLDNLDDGGNN